MNTYSTLCQFKNPMYFTMTLKNTVLGKMFLVFAILLKRFMALECLRARYQNDWSLVEFHLFQLNTLEAGSFTLRLHSHCLAQSR